MQSFKTLYLKYQSKVDWTAERDILRCSSLFQGSPRHDCIIYADADTPLAFARLLAVLRVGVPNGQDIDLAMVHNFRNSKWKPQTAWKGCKVVDEQRSVDFIPLDCVARGALLAQARGSSRKDVYFVVDTVDDDMYLRINCID